MGSYSNTARISGGSWRCFLRQNSTPASISPPAIEQLASTKKFQNLRSIESYSPPSPHSLLPIPQSPANVETPLYFLTLFFQCLYFRDY
ncbi:hypothetical protein H1Q63_05085 [Desmonostoc muscorum CCALA 125]|nr:hypothetical protein [Desmonostoc muscorum CCALA 125]